MLKATRSDRDGASVFKSTIKVMVIDHNKDLLNSVSDFLMSRSFEGNYLVFFFSQDDKFLRILLEASPKLR